MTAAVASKPGLRRTQSVLAALAAATVFSAGGIVGGSPAVAAPLGPVGPRTPVAAAAAPAPAGAWPAAVPAVTKRTLLLQISAALGSHASDVGVSVRDRRTGAVFAYNPNLVNCTGSIVKVLVLVTTIRQARSAGHGLSTRQRSLAARMIRYSDNDATTTLFRAAGGAASITRTARLLGLTRTKGAASWGRTTTTAADQRLLMDKLVGGTPVISGADRRYLIALMRTVIASQRWGVGAVPRKGTKVALKNGWVPLSPRAWRINSIGHVVGNNRDYTIAIVSYDNPTMSGGVRRANAVSTLVYASLARAWG